MKVVNRMQYFEWQSSILFLGYYVIIAGLLALITRFCSVQQEIIRKGYHLMATGSIIILLYAFSHWISALYAVLFLATLVYIILPLAIKIPGMNKLSIGRQGKFKEVLKQAGYFFIALISLITLIWGGAGDDYKIHIVMGMAALGIGDAAAALIGKKFGKHQFKMFFDKQKSVEGSVAMAITVFLTAFMLLYFFTNQTLLPALISSVIIGLVSATVEAICVNGLDTIIIPLIISFLSLGLSLI